MISTSRRAALGGALATLALPAPVLAGSLSLGERETLDRGLTVKRKADVDIEGTGYLGVLTYRRIVAPPTAVFAVLSDAKEGMHVLPHAIESHWVDGNRDGDKRIALKVGTKKVNAAFVLRMRYETRRLVKFFVDQDFPHGVNDLFGFFRTDPYPEGGSLLTVAGACDLGFGILKLFFQEIIRENLFEIAGNVDRRSQLRMRRDLPRFGDR